MKANLPSNFLVGILDWDNFHINLGRKLDHSIRNNLEDLQIAQYVNMLMSGMVSEIDLRKSALDRQ